MTTLDALLSFMTNPDTWITKRMEAAEQLLYAPSEYAVAARAYLSEVYEDATLDDALRLGALKMIRKADVRRTPPAPTPEVRRDLLIARRRIALVKAGLWPPAAGWDADLRAPDGEAEVTGEMSTRLRRARLKVVGGRDVKVAGLS